MHASVHLLSAAYAHVVKSLMPVFVVLFSLLLGQRFPLKTYGALTMIITGVAITSQGEASFNGLGFAAALGSTMAGAAYGFIMKKALIITELHEFQMLTLISGLSLILLLPVWLVVDFRQIFLPTGDSPTNAAAATTKVLCLLLADGFSRYLQNSLGVLLLARLSPVGYSVGNVMKRLFTILSSLLFFASPVTLLHIVGIGTAMLGLLAYNLIRTPRRQSIELVEASCPDTSPVERIPADAAHASFPDSKFSSSIPDQENAPLRIDGCQLEEVDSFKYLGARLLPNGQSKDDIVSRIDAARWVFSSLRKCLWIRRDLSIATKIREYHASVRSVLLYGCECWALRVENERKLEATAISAADEDIQKGHLVVFFLLHRKLHGQEESIEMFFECQHPILFDDEEENTEGISHRCSPSRRSAVSICPMDSSGVFDGSMNMKMHSMRPNSFTSTSSDSDGLEDAPLPHGDRDFFSNYHPRQRRKGFDCSMRD
ncbi:hypothetical protein SprV_0602067500 [Sparganum proliferum]